MNKDADLQKNHEDMKLKVEQLKKKADSSKVSKLWALVPVAGWVYMGVQKNKRKGYKQKLVGQEKQVEESKEGMENIQKVLVQVEDNLIPALESYMESVQGLQSIF